MQIKQHLNFVCRVNVNAAGHEYRLRMHVLQQTLNAYGNIIIHHVHPFTISSTVASDCICLVAYVCMYACMYVKTIYIYIETYICTASRHQLLMSWFTNVREIRYGS